MKIRLILSFLAAGWVAGCTPADVGQYRSEKPALVLEEYFSGPMTAHGLLMNRWGTVTRRFVVHVNTVWRNGTATMTEDFDWSDGEKNQRVWTVTRQGDNLYRGTAPDILGTADGASSGNAFHWKYEMDLKMGSSSYKISFDDRMYLIDQNVLLNEAVLYWYGIRVGKLLISFDRR